MFTALSQVPGLLPQFETRRALVIINLQNDSLYSDGDIYITKNREFVDRVKLVVPYFRTVGDVVWVRTEIGTKSFPTSPGSASIEEEVAKTDEKNREERKVEEEQLEDDTADYDSEDPRPEPQHLGTDASKKDYPFYHPSSRSKAMMMRASAKSRAEQRTANMDVFNDSNDVFEEHMSKPRKGQQPRFYISGTPGAEIADQLLSVVDESRDLFVTKHHYSAFDQTPLLTSLRMRLVTDIYLCGCLTNVGVYATAADAVQHGLVVTVVEDCLGYRSEDKHEGAMRQMADIMGVNGIDSEEIIEEVGGKPPDADESIFSGPGLEGINMNNLSIAQPIPKLETFEAVEAPPVGYDGAADELNHITPESQDLIQAEGPSATPPPMSVETGDPAEPVAAPVENKERPNIQRSKSASDGMTPLPSPGISSSRKRDSWVSAGTHTLGPQDSIGAGDSRIIHDVLDSPLGDDVFPLLKEEVGWQNMYHRSGKVPRLVAVQGEILPDGSIPIYRHPADESPRLLSFSPTVQKIRREVERLLKQPFNHALIQLYRDGTDNISEHSDKTLDISRGSEIVNVSLGAQRIMTLRTKKLRRTHGTESPGNLRQSQRIHLPHNSVFVLGPQTNMQWLHGVRADKRPSQQKSDEEKAFEGERISITFRHIATFVELSTQRIWGQGAKQKEKVAAGRILSRDHAEMEAMIEAFGKENHQPDFDWDKEYGLGFDVIDLVSEKTKLTLCDDKVANLRVRLCLSEKRIHCVLSERTIAAPVDTRTTRYKFHPWSHGLSNSEKPTFRDVDEDASETEGDLAILFYLEKFYPFPAPEGASARELHRATALIYTRASKSNELLFWWRELQAMHPDRTNSLSVAPDPGAERPVTPNLTFLEEFNQDLDVWEGYAAEAEFIAGDFWTIIDCAFWPVIDDIISGWEKFDAGRYPKLVDYHQRVLGRERVQKALEGKA